MFWAFFFALLFHIVIFLSVQPTLYKQDTPVLTSWLGLLSIDDLKSSSLHKSPLSKELIPSQISKSFFLTFHPDSSVPGRVHQRGIFSKKEALAYVFREEVVLSKEFIPFAPITDTESRELIYRAEISPQGRVLLVTPLILPIHVSTENYVEEYLKSSFFRLGENDFIWTNVYLVIE
ncbi:MAG: hypothetical protein JXD21_05560 [Candidatus Omnitrophica bacterium]|nr:hypothetical protein [Candidatus Omnitrophota bacterium]